MESRPLHPKKLHQKNARDIPFLYDVCVPQDIWQPFEVSAYDLFVLTFNGSFLDPGDNLSPTFPCWVGWL